MLELLLALISGQFPKVLGGIGLTLQQGEFKSGKGQESSPDITKIWSLKAQSLASVSSW